MFSLFKSFFGSETEHHGNYPGELLEKAMDRAIDGVDSRLRVLGSYRKRLKPAIIPAIDHVVDLVDQLPAGIDAASSRYKQDPYLAAMFASADDLQHFFSNDRQLRAYLDSLRRPVPEYITAMLAMDRAEKRVFGVEMHGEVLRRDVAQLTVNFSSHYLVDVCDSEDETRRLLKRRAFDHLITMALHDVMESRKVREELEQQHRLFKRKLATLEAEGWGLDAGEIGLATNHQAAQSQLQQIESQLEALPARTELLDANLDILINIFRDAPDKIYRETHSMIVDRMNIRQKSLSDKSNELTWHDIHIASGQVRTVMLVKYPTNELLTPRKSARKNIYQ